MDKRIHGIRQITRNPFLNFYEFDTEDRKGARHPYYVASRAADTAGLLACTPDAPEKADGVAIYCLYGEARDRVVLIRQFRYALGGWIYEFPAGLVEPGEDILAAGARELKEETGLDFTPVKADRALLRPFFTTAGMTDERCSIIFGTASGQIDLGGLEDTESLQVVLADRAQAASILRTGQVAVQCAYMLMHFIADTEDPFRFLQALGAESDERTEETFSEEETYAAGQRLGEQAVPGQVIALCGDLGVGKTVFTRGFAAGLGIEEDVTSPTFTILQEYTDGRIPLYHFDVYRIGDPEEMDEIGFDEYVTGDGVCLIEWADLIAPILPQDCLRVEIAKDPERGFDYRRITIGKMPGGEGK